MIPFSELQLGERFELEAMQFIKIDMTDERVNAVSQINNDERIVELNRQVWRYKPGTPMQWEEEE